MTHTKIGLHTPQGFLVQWLSLCHVNTQKIECLRSFRILPGRFTTQMGGDLAQSLGREKICTIFFREKNSILTSKISDDLFSHRPYFVCLLPVSTINLILSNIYDPLLAEKPPFQKKSFLHDTFF